MNNGPLAMAESEQRVVACLAARSRLEVTTGKRVPSAALPPKLLG
jgi:hypothetical protein